MKDNKYSFEIGNDKITVNLNNFAAQANGSLLIEHGETVAMITVVMSQRDAYRDFFPLSVEFEEKYYAAGKIRGSRYIKREGRPSDESILTARAIDRCVRPLFPEGFEKEVQLIATCLSWDGKNDPDIASMIGASLVLSCSNIPWSGPISAVRVGLIDNEFVINPDYEQREKSKIDVIFGGAEKNGEILINMIEGKCEEAEEKTLNNAFDFAKPYLQKLIDFQKEIIKKNAREKIEVAKEEIDETFKKEFEKKYLKKIENALYEQKLDEIKKFSFEILENEIKKDYEIDEEKKLAGKLLSHYLNDVLHKKILETGIRPDGRKLNEIRPLTCNIDFLPRIHGSGLFQRGLTKSLSILTLGAPGDQQLLEGMEIVGKKRFLHHYNFPPFAPGEIKPLRGPGRREIGHGMLGEKALLPIIPNFEDFPYTIRIVTEIISSNGSTSMAAPCSSSLALMAGGVPIKRPAAGIAMGLILGENGDYKILTDIQGPEDNNGDMDFKVVGTEKGITALQMDVKISGITKEIFQETLIKAKKAREAILKEMSKTIEKPREKLSPFAPKIYTIKINPEKIGEVVGPRGKIINEIIEHCEVTIDIEQDGSIYITSEKEEGAQKALEWIKNIARELKVGEIFQGKVVKIMDFGAFVEILPGQDGLIHISEIAPYRIAKVDDVLKIGDLVKVKIVEIDHLGRINLSSRDFFDKNKKS